MLHASPNNILLAANQKPISSKNIEEFSGKKSQDNGPAAKNNYNNNNNNNNKIKTETITGLSRRTSE